MYRGDTVGLRREAAGTRRGPVRQAARGAGGGDGAKMAGPALVFGPELGHAAGSTTACERRRRPWSPWASAGRVAGFLSPSPSAVRDSFLLASSPCLHPQPRPTSAPHWFEVHILWGARPLGPGNFFFFLILQRNNGIEGGECGEAFPTLFVVVVVFYLWVLKWRCLETGILRFGTSDSFS